MQCVVQQVEHRQQFSDWICYCLDCMFNKNDVFIDWSTGFHPWERCSNGVSEECLYNWVWGIHWFSALVPSSCSTGITQIPIRDTTFAYPRSPTALIQQRMGFLRFQMCLAIDASNERWIPFVMLVTPLHCPSIAWNSVQLDPSRDAPASEIYSLATMIATAATTSNTTAMEFKGECDRYSHVTTIESSAKISGLIALFLKEKDSNGYDVAVLLASEMYYVSPPKNSK